MAVICSSFMRGKAVLIATVPHALSLLVSNRYRQPQMLAKPREWRRMPEVSATPGGIRSFLNALQECNPHDQASIWDRLRCRQEHCGD